MTQKLLIGVFCLVVVLTQTWQATAADIRPFVAGSGSFRAIIIEGNIETGDFETFIRVAKENQGNISTVYIFQVVVISMRP